MTITIEGPLKNAASLCEPILRALPSWFGIEEATLRYIDDTNRLPTLIARADGEVVGFLTWKRHAPLSAEIQVMGVLPDRHRRGVGRALLRHAEAALAASGVRFFQVKTLSAAHKDEGYGRTRAFYQSQGFQELEQHPTLWGEANPCLQMLKTLEPASEESDSGLQFSSVGSDQVSERLEVDMATLLGSCFEGYPPRAFYKQIPHRRWLCHAGDALVAVAGTDFRLMRCGDRRLRVTGIIDICVDKAYRARGIAANFLNAIEARATESRSDLLLLFADDHRLYKRAGYFPARNPVRLLALNKDRSHSVLSRPYPKSLMLKSLMEGDWDHEEELDLLGYLY